MGDYDDYRHRGRGERSPDGIANQIILKRNYPGYESYSFLLVEGETDQMLYTKFVDKEKCQIISAIGKTNVIQALLILEKALFPGVLAIIDADLDVLEDTLPVSPNMCYTDLHNLETMLIRSPALESVLYESGSTEKIKQMTQKDIRTLLLECGMPIGYLRWVSLREDLHLVFKGLEFDTFMDRDALTIDQAKLIQAVKDKSKKHDLVETQLQASIQKLQNDTHDPWHVCCGHDLIRLLSKGLHSVLSKEKKNTNDVNPDRLGHDLRLAFEHAYFYKTQLYLFMQKWEKVNVPYVILAAE
ncbi:MAG: DUF4435 domain-containing protein [Ktedonobacteraceae bacterium]